MYQRDGPMQVGDNQGKNLELLLEEFIRRDLSQVVVQITIEIHSMDVKWLIVRDTSNMQHSNQEWQQDTKRTMMIIILNQEFSIK